MTQDQAKIFFEEVNDQRDFRRVIAARLDMQMGLVIKLVSKMEALSQRLDEYIEAQTYDVKGKR
jgi:hypothetical protein